MSSSTSGFLGHIHSLLLAFFSIPDIPNLSTNQIGLAGVLKKLEQGKGPLYPTMYLSIEESGIWRQSHDEAFSFRRPWARGRYSHRRRKHVTQTEVWPWRALETNTGHDSIYIPSVFVLAEKALSLGRECGGENAAKWTRRSVAREKCTPGASCTKLGVNMPMPSRQNLLLLHHLRLPIHAAWVYQGSQQDSREQRARRGTGSRDLYTPRSRPMCCIDYPSVTPSHRSRSASRHSTFWMQ